MLCCLIMAGGMGERFWPASSEEKPKQFLNIFGTDTMLQSTVKRMEKLVSIENIFVCTSKKHVGIVSQQLPKLPKRNIIGEPMGRNTAPCIVLTALIAEEYYGNVTLIVVPSDHKIESEENYIRDLIAASSFIEEKEDSICLLGITPDRPETGYGYIKVDKLEKNINKIDIFKIDKFVEKPDKATAEEYLRAGNFLWSCGMFIWKTNTIKKLAKELIPDIYIKLDNAMVDFNKNNFEESLLAAYESIKGTSIDVSIMEKAKDIFIIPGGFKWDDVGTWLSVQRNGEKDSSGNTFIGDIHAIEAKNNFIMSGGKKIILMDIDDLFVIDSDKYIVIGKKELISNVAALKKQFENSGITNKSITKSHILLDNQKLKSTGSTMYTMDECLDNCAVEKGWNIKTHENYEIAEMQLVLEDNKNYIVGKGAEDNWFGVEVNPKTVETLKEMETDKVLKFFQKELSR
jgi:mannose-1-phosphate guanylyltransferase